MSGKNILLDHGSGGLASQQLISNLFLKYLDNRTLHSLEDSAEPDPGRAHLYEQRLPVFRKAGEYLASLGDALAEQA